MRSDDRKRYILFGTGDYYNRFHHWFIGREVAAVLDNDEKKQGTTIDGHAVMAPMDVRELEYDAIVILSFYVTAMKKQLLELGVPESKIFHFFDLHELIRTEEYEVPIKLNGGKSILLLSHDLSLGGPALALYHAAKALGRAEYEVVYASMLDGELRSKLEENGVQVVVDNRLQINKMMELPWTRRFDLVICNTINYHVFLSERDEAIPVIWWLHDSAFFYEGIKPERLSAINTNGMKILSVGPIPRAAIKKYLPDVTVEDLIYGVSDGE
jgi:hypothetical protein